MTTLTETQQPLTVIRSTASIHKSVQHIKQNEALSEWMEIRKHRSGMPLETVIYLAPAVLDRNDVRTTDETPCCTIAFTRDLSRKRISFSHDSPLMVRHVVATFDLIDDESVSLLVEIKWQRQREAAWYLTGGKLLGVVR